MKNRIIILYLILFNIASAIGLKALVIPQSAIVMSTSNSGIGDALSPDINPASISNVKPFFGFSRNIWLGDLQGQKVLVLWDDKNIYSQFSFESLNVNDIELRNDVASETPIGFFGAFWYAFDFSRSVNIEKLFPNLNDLKIGYKIKFNLSKLYTESMYGATFDIGMQKKINNNISLGFVFKNYGKEVNKNLKVSTPKLLGLGISYKTPKIPLKILSDIVFQDKHTLTKISLNTDFKYINLILGKTKGKDYDDVAFGLSIKLKNWSLIYANLKHDNSNLGNPSSIELRKYF
tara:strand:+ start:5618 stop:6490 length:873 start_codon:yes stop_codon:yes gene_type:complete